MEPYADAGCVLKVNVHFQACKMKMMEVLNSICGVYSVIIDAEEGTARVSGLVDPNILMRALARTGYHAELKWVKLKHPELSRCYFGQCNYGHGYTYGAIDDPYKYPRTLPYYYPRRSVYPFHGSSYYHPSLSLPS
ncbi:uncharacterized protein LOC111395144 [Olea europaea var. sylvestris]|uniref:uncharacterized protein LOC111395144 n=1 Tax=Olea europaea var. sylvestris TaxID=158386 RepID=UPI000C1D0302|nr:uncharacterized protein LOC111395144 [Olea europaea var. sylvestris]